MVSAFNLDLDLESRPWIDGFPVDDYLDFNDDFKEEWAGPQRKPGTCIASGRAIHAAYREGLHFLKMRVTLFIQNFKAKVHFFLTSLLNSSRKEGRKKESPMYVHFKI